MAQQSEHLTECPKSPDRLHFATWWYRLHNVSEFRVCSKCYVEKLASSPFAAYFEKFHLTPSATEIASCNFNCLTVDHIFNYCIQASYNNHHQNLAILEAHARARMQVKSCPGAEGITGFNGIKWYGIPQIPDFMACEACYMDFVCGSSFSLHFSPYPAQQQADQTWACDIANLFIKKHLIEDSKRLDWSTFVSASSHRLNMPRCEGADLSLGQTKWLIPRAAPTAVICETCYLDEIALLPQTITDQFCELGPLLQHPVPEHLMTKCSFSKLPFQLCSNQLLEKDFGRWTSVVGQIIDLLPNICGVNLEDREWYVLVNPWNGQTTNFTLCEACYLGSMESSNHRDMFRRERISGPRSCECNASNSRFAQSVPTITELLMTRDTNKFLNFATQLQPSVSSSYLPPGLISSPGPPQNSPGYADAAAMSQKLAQQHAMNMGMMNMVFAANQKHNAAMSGIMNYGSSYNTWNDPKWNHANYDYQQAQNQFLNAPTQPGWLGKKT